MSTPYYPHRSNKIAAIFIITITLAWGLLFCYMLCASLTLDFWFLFLLSFFVLFSIWSLKIGFSTSKTHITCDPYCIHIYERNVQHSIGWNDLSYKYVSRDFKGHKYLILSSCELQKSDIKKAIRQNIHKSQVCFDNYYVIYSDWGQPQLFQDLERFIDANMGQNTKEK